MTKTRPHSEPTKPVPLPPEPAVRVAREVRLINKVKVFGKYTEFVSLDAKEHAVKADSITLDGNGALCTLGGDAILFPWSQLCYVEYRG